MTRLKDNMQFFFRQIILLGIAFFVDIPALAQNSEVILEYEAKISDYGLYFDGNAVPADKRLTHPNRTDGKYDFAFGRIITPHGDCIAQYGDYVFVTWYHGGKSVRNVMLTRINTATKSIVTIEFPHRHTGFQNRWHVGESHNTIAVGICPIDETVHLLYDMHAYSSTRPEDGSLSNDYFRYSVSLRNVATLPDEEFTLDQFQPMKLYLKPGENYTGLTYPDFFVNTQGELLVKMRVGGNSNGKFQMAKYDGNEWTNWVDYNVLNADSYTDINYNWGLYGSIQYLHGKFQIGYAIRKNTSTDKYVYNNGFFYAYSTFADGSRDWYNYEGQAVSSPIVNPYEVFVSEPGDEISATAANSVTISSGPKWTVTERGDIHFMVNSVRGAGANVDVHTYKKESDTYFTTTKSFPGGDELRSIGDDIYLIGLSNGRPIIRKAEGGTNNWTVIYQATTGKTFRHGSVLVKDGKIYYYLMENRSGNAQPIYLQIYNLNLHLDDPSAPSISIESPDNGALFQYGEAFDITADALSPEDYITKVEFYVNSNLISQDDVHPFSTSVSPELHGYYTLLAKAYDDKGRSATSAPVTVTVERPHLPQLLISTAADAGMVARIPDKNYYEEGEEVWLTPEANPGFRFLSWTGDYAGTDNPLVLKMDSTIRITANFKPTYAVTISENTVNGNVELSPQKDFYDAGEIISFTPYPAPGYHFDSWYAEGGVAGSVIPLMISINRDIELSAYFNLITYQLFPSASHGIITRNPHSVVYPLGTEVELTATPNEGYYFSGWSGYLTSQENPISIQMDSTIYVTANFDITSNIAQQNVMKWRIYPNPSNGVFNVETGQRSGYTVYTLSGLRLIEGEGYGNFEIDLKGYAKGIYLLEVQTHSGVALESIAIK